MTKNLREYLNLSKTKVNINGYYQLNIADITIEVIKKGIKNMHIAVYPPNGRVRIAAPEQTSDDAIRLFGVSKIAWIKKNQQKYLAQERETVREYLNGESLMYKGKRYLLKIVDNAADDKVVIINKKYVEVHNKAFSNPFSVEKQYENWLRLELKKTVERTIKKWEEVTKIKVGNWKIQKMKTRWGSCSKVTGNILVNFELIKKPETCIEYVVLHEIIHLVEPKHNDNFIKHLDKFLPKWRIYKQELAKGMLPHTTWDH